MQTGTSGKAIPLMEHFRFKTMFPKHEQNHAFFLEKRWLAFMMSRRLVGVAVYLFTQSFDFDFDTDKMNCMNLNQ